MRGSYRYHQALFLAHLPCFGLPCNRVFNKQPLTYRIACESGKKKPSGSSFPHRSVVSFETRKPEPKGSVLSCCDA